MRTQIVNNILVTRPEDGNILPLDGLGFYSQIHQDNYVTVGEVEINSPVFGRILGRGVARRNPIDRHNPNLASRLAEARAYEQIARKLKRQVDGDSRHQDNLIAAAERQKANPKPKKRSNTTIKVTLVSQKKEKKSAKIKG